MRQVVLDTETTGLETGQGHRIIEIGCVELLNRRLSGRHYHQYINPQREVDEGALEVHGITDEFLRDKPLFEDIVEDFVQFIEGAELIIHNAPFDVGFINNEFQLLSPQRAPLDSLCSILDSLQLAREKHPGQKNNLDALCKRYEVDNTQRDLHGALLDAEILADVYLRMTGGQTDLLLSADENKTSLAQLVDTRIDTSRGALKVVHSTDEELHAHQDNLRRIDKASGGNCVWLKL